MSARVVVWAERQPEAIEFARQAGLKRGEVLCLGNASEFSALGVMPSAIILLPGAEDDSASATRVRIALERSCLTAPPGREPSWIDLRGLLR